MESTHHQSFNRSMYHNRSFYFNLFEYRNKCSSDPCFLYIDVSLTRKSRGDPGNSSLHDAVLFENLMKVKALTVNTQSIYCKNNYGLTPLHFCSYIVDTSIVDHFISKGVNLNECDSNGNTLLCHAISLNNEKVVDKLLEKKVRLNTLNSKGGSPLLIATTFGNSLFVRKLIESGASVNQCDNEGNTPLHIACAIAKKSPKMLLIIDMLLQTGIDVNKPNMQGNTPLLIATYHSQRAVIKMLLEKKTMQPHCISEQDNSLELSSTGIDISCRTKNHDTPLHIACGMGDADICNLLLDEGAEVNLKNVVGNTPLHLAKSSITSEKLIKKGADFSIRNNIGDTAMHNYIINGGGNDYHLKKGGSQKRGGHYISFPLEERVNLDMKNKRGNTVLHTAAAQADRNWLLFLLKIGAAVNARNNCDKTPRDLASVYSSQAIFLFEFEIKLVLAGLLDDSKITFDVQKHASSCNEELEIIKNTVVLQGHFLDVVFTKRKNPYYLSNCELTSALEKMFEEPNFEKKFPLYSLILRNTFERTKTRFQLLTMGMDSISGSNKKPLLRDLPSVFKRMLLNYLDNEALYNLTKSI